MSQNKKYIIEVATNPASLKKLREDLEKATKLQEGVEIPELSRETKAQVKRDLATMFGVAEHQAEALQKMMQAAAEGFADGKSVDALKRQLEETLEFTNTIMQNMYKMDDATSWMDRGVTFVDDFIKMKDSIGTIESVEKSVGRLEKTFEKFKDALAETNADAFLQRFGTSTRNDAQEFALAQKTLQKLAKTRYKAVSEAIASGQSEEFDYTGYDTEELEAEYKDAIRIISESNRKIEQLSQKYKGKKSELYKDTDYLSTISDMSMALHQLDNMHGLGDGLGSELRASMQIATDSVREAGNEIQNLVKKLQGQGIELAITLPDAGSVKFASQINEFVKNASDEFKNHPIEMTLDITSPFKKDALTKDGELKKLSEKQLGLSQEIEKTFRENLQKEDMQIGEDDLNGLYSINTNVISRNIVDAFNKLYKSMTSGQALITSATKKWREKIEEDLTVKPTFATELAKKEVAQAIEDIEAEMEGGEYDLTLYPNTEQLVAEIQEALKADKFLIDVKVDNVDASGVVLNVDSAQINSGGYIPVGYAPMQFAPQGTPPTQPTPPTTQQTKEQPTLASSAQKTAQQSTTRALTQNSETVTEGTIAQRILTDAVNDLSQSLSTIDDRMQSVQDRISAVEKQRDKNAKEIENNQKSVDTHNKRREVAAANKQSSQEQLKQKKEDKVFEENQISNIQSELRNALKRGDIQGFNDRLKPILDKLPQIKTLIHNEIESIKSNEGMTEAAKETDITKLNSYIKTIEKLLNPDIDLTTAVNDHGTKIYFEAVRLAYRDRLAQLDAEIAKLTDEVESRQRAYTNADMAVTNARQRERELSGEDTEENAEKQLEKFKSEKGALESRKKKIQKVLDNNEDPVTLVLDEVAEYWKTSDKKIADAEQYISKNEVKLKKLEKELEAYEDKNSAEYKKKQKEYDEENARLHKDKKYVSSKNAIETWTERNAVMRAAGLDLKEMKSGNEIEEITRVLVENAVLADALSNNKSLKGLSNIQNMAYFIPKVQQTLGVDTRAYEDYMSEQELRSNFLEALKINEYIVAARNMLKTGDTDISPTDVQNFIDYFADIPEMADAVNIARQYLEEVSKLPEETWKKDIQETYFDQFKNTWESMDKDSRRAFADAYSDSQQAHGFRFTDFKNVDNDLFARILSAFNENESPLKGLQTDNKQIQQILGILQRSSLLTTTKDISNQYGEHGILASLFGIQKSNLMGNKYAPKAPIYITTHDSKDREKIYELGAKGGRSQSSDGKFNFTPESFDRMIKKTNTADEMAELVSLIYDPLVLQNEKLEHKIRDIRSDLNTLKTLDFSDDESATDSKKKMRRMSYNALDGTDIEKDWHRLKNLQGEVVSIRSALKSGLDDVVLPDVLWKNIKGLRKQRGLEKEIRGLDHGEFSDEIKRQLKGLTDKEKEKKVKEIKSEKVAELDELKKQNIKDVTKFLLEKVKQYRNLEDQIIAQTDEVIASKEKELEAAETQHKKNAPVVAQRKREADELLQQMFESGKFKLSHGKGTVTPKWDQKYEYKDSKLAKFEEQKAINDRTIEILKQQNEDDRQLLNVLQSNKTNDKIDEMLNNLSDADKKKPKEAQLDLVKNKITTAISRRDAEIERLQNVEISLKDIIDSIITLEDDIERGKEKEKHESQLSSADRRRSKRVLNSNKRQFTAKRKAYESALYSEARQFNLNNQLKTSKTGSTQENQPEFSNLLSKIKLASDWEIFDTTKINGMVDEYLALIEKAKALSVSDTASDADIADIEKEIRAAQDKLIKEWFGTDSWYLVDLIEQRFSVIDGDLKREEQEIMSEASSAKEADDATKTAIAEQKKKAKQSLEEYINQLKAQYIDKPKEEILLALNREVAGINTDAASVAAELEAVDGRADKALEEQRRALVQQYQNDPLYKQLLEQRSKVLNSEAYNLKDANSDAYKAAHKQVEDIGKSMAEIEHAYDQKFKELRDKWIAEEKERILKTSTKDSYSKNAYKLKEAYDKRDRDLATVHQRAQQDSGLISIKEQVAKELQKDEEYINLLQQYNKMSKTEQESESGKNIYSQIQSIKQKYEQKIVDAVNTWKNEEIKRINKTFDNTVSNIVNSILRNKRSGIRDNQLSTLEQQKEFVIDRLFIANSEFSDLITNVIADLTKQLGNNPDAFQVSEELVKRGLPKDINFEDAFILSTNKIETGEQYKVYFKRVQDALLEQVGKMLQVMVDSADNPELVSEEQIKAQIEAKRAKAVKKKQEEVASIKGKTSRELLSDRYDDTSEEHAGKAAGIKRDREKLEADRKRIMRDYGKSHGLTPEMVAAARKGTLIVKLNAKKVETTTSQETPKKEQPTSKPQQTRQTTPTPQQKTTSQPMKPQGGGFVYGPYGYTPAIIDTSDLAKEGTLRGLYELFNGGAPKGGWDDSISEGSKVHETPSPTPVDNESDEIAGSAQKFVSSLQSIISSAATRKTEMAALIGESGQLGARIQGTKNGVKAKDISAALAEQVKEQVLAVLHNHPSGSATLSSNDLQAAYNRAYSKGSYAGNKPVKISGAVANGKITAVDFSDIEESDAAKIVAEYQKQRDALVDATEEDIYNTLVSVFTQFGHANAVQQVDASKLEEWRNSIVSKAQQQVAEDVIETGAQTAVDVTKDIPQTDASTPTQTIEDVIGSDLPSDILSIYKAVFDKFDFKDALGNRINELIGKCRDYVEMQFEEGELTDEVIGDLFKVADNGELTIASEDLYKAKDIRNRIISILLDSIDDNFDINGFAKLYEDNKANIKQALESIIPDAYSSDSTSKKTPAKKEKASKKDKPVEQTSKPAEKAVKSAKEAENANRAITSEQEQQSTLSAEIAQNTEKAASAAKEQAKAQSEVVTSQKERVSSSATFDTGAQQQTTQPKSYEHNYKLGLAGLAQESTLKSILGELSSGIKVTSDKKGGGGKQGGKKKSDDKSLNVTANDAWATAQKYIKENYPDFTSLSALKPVSGGYSIDVFRPNNLEAYAAAQKKVNDLIAEGKQGTDEFNQAQAELNKLKFEQEKITLKIGNLNDEVQVTQEKSGFQNLALGIKAASKELQTVEGVLTQLHEVGALSIGADGAPTSSIASVDKYLGKLKALQDYQNKLSPEQLFDIDVQQDLSRLALDLQNARKEVMLLAKASAQLNIGEKIETDKLADGIEGLSDSGVKQVMKDIIADSTKLETSFKDLTPVTNEFGEVIGYKLAYTVRTSKHEVQEMTAVLNPLTNELRVQKGAVKDAATGWKVFFDGLKGKAASIMQYLISITSIHDMFRYVGQGVQYVREIDSALTELKKVTDETDASYAKFLQNMSKTGSVIGATVADLTTSAADWARLGYSMQQAGELAKNTSILMNVSEFEDVSKATDTLISALQAFKEEGQDVGTFSMEIIDKYNEVGNNYAISTSDLAESLTRSSAALVAANNSLEQSIAMTTAANTTIQDPESVGKIFCRR